MGIQRFLLSVFVLGFHQLIHCEQKSQKLNVILIMADDSAADNYGCYGSTYFKTPILDQLAKSGAKFNHCYSEPVCTPSRVKIMTGRSGIRNYAQFGTLDKDEITFGNIMKKAGYSTAVAGKWQLHNGERGTLAPDCGFDTYCLWNYPGTGSSRYWNPSIMQDGKLLKTNKNHYGPDIFSNFIIDFIKSHKDSPFFVYYPMSLVHSPFPKTPDNLPDDKKTAQGKGMALSNFKDMTLYADKIVGKIINCLKENNLRENTVLIYTTDNGTHRNLTYPYKNEQRKGEKAYATQGGTHVPLIVNCPGTIPEGITSNDLIDFSDFLPTITEITKTPLPNIKLDGQSFWPQCIGKKGKPRKWIFHYYYPKYSPAAKPHGQGINGMEIIWAQNQLFKLYQNGKLYSSKDRHEIHEIKRGKNKGADETRKLLQEAINSMPKQAVKLQLKK